MKTTQLILAVMILIAACTCCQPLVAQDHFNQRLQATVDRAKSNGLAAGMTTTQVEGIIGKPDNKDWDVVFPLGKDKLQVWLCVDKRSNELVSWRDFVTDTKGFGLGYFYLFVNDRLETHVPSLTSKDADVLFNLAKKTSKPTTPTQPTPQPPAKP